MTQGFSNLRSHPVILTERITTETPIAKYMKIEWSEDVYQKLLAFYIKICNRGTPPTQRQKQQYWRVRSILKRRWSERALRLAIGIDA